MPKIILHDQRLTELLCNVDDEWMDIDAPPVASEELCSILRELIAARELMKGRHVLVQWLNAETNPRIRATGFNAGRSAWKFHAVLSDPRQKFEEIKGVHALCGLKPRHGWGMDLFMDIDDEVAGRCLKCYYKTLELGLGGKIAHLEFSIAERRNTGESSTAAETTTNYQTQKAGTNVRTNQKR